MLNKKVIQEINSTCKVFFLESTFVISPTSANRFGLRGNNQSKALNNFGSLSEEVDVVKWFNDFWVHIDIRIENKYTLVSLSVFQGESNDQVKHQLFRAEWDDYFTNDDKHPQPHWHVSTNQRIEKTFVEIAEYDNKSDFLKLLNAEKSKTIDINKMHFAMNSDWLIDKDKHAHSITSINIVNWFQGLFSCLRNELDYVTRSS